MYINTVYLSVVVGTILKQSVKNIDRLIETVIWNIFKVNETLS